MNSKTALVTGASSGIGYEFAKLLARECATLVLVARNRDRLEAAKKELEREAGVSVVLISADLSRAGAAEEVYAELVRRKLTVDILVNAAGFGSYGPFSETDAQRDAGMIAVNITALTGLTKLLVTGMKERGSGRIVNVASTAAFQPGPLMAVYYASKAYVLHFSEAVANELQGTGVTVTALCPGPTATGFAAAAGLERSRLFTVLRPAAAAEVARYGYGAMTKGKVVAIPGFLNKLGAFCGRFAPRRLLTALLRSLHGPARCNAGAAACL